MTYHNEGTRLIEIDGIEIHAADDFDGASVGLFLSKAKALAAQRAVNVKKMLLKANKSAGQIDSYSCESEFDDGEIATWHTSFDGRDWLEPEEDLTVNLNTSTVASKI